MFFLSLATNETTMAPTLPSVPTTSVGDTSQQQVGGSTAHLFSQPTSSPQFVTQPQPSTQQTSGYGPTSTGQAAQVTPSAPLSQQQPADPSTASYYPQQQPYPQQPNQQPAYAGSYSAQPSAPNPPPAPTQIPAPGYNPAQTSPYPSSSQPPYSSSSYAPPTGSYPQQYGGTSGYGQPSSGQTSYASYPKQGPQYTQQAYGVYRNQPQY